jgi:hypothetical protein
MGRGLALKGSYFGWGDWAIDGLVVLTIITAAIAVRYLL